MLQGYGARGRAERGIIVKLAGRVVPDPATGRLTVIFEDDPPLQFERFNSHRPPHRAGVPLEGPAYFVSHGGEEFPKLTMVLQGDGVTVELVGDTFIQNGVTTSTFRSTPDVPFESFELHLPKGSNSALAANGDLCRQKLVMPTAFTAQNGLQLKQSTKIAVSGCPKAKKKAKKKK